MSSIPGKSKKLEVLKTPFCGDLRSKKYFMSEQILTEAEDYHDASGYTWCYNTQMPIGPDGSRAAPEYCGQGRSCYRSAFQEPEPWKPYDPNAKKEDEDKVENENPEI